MESEISLLKDSEIIQFLRDHGIEITDNKSLYKPDPHLLSEMLSTVFKSNSALLLSVQVYVYRKIKISCMI